MSVESILKGFFIKDKTTGLAAEVSARSQTPTGPALQVQIGPGDIISNLPVMIDFEHHQIHEGESWEYWSFGALNSATRDFRISVPTISPSIRGPHLIPEIIMDNTTAQIFFYEGTTWTSGGTDDSAKIFNRNRNTGGAPATKVYINGATALTPNALGTQFFQGYLFSGKAVSNVERALSEWVLKSNTEYLLRITTVGNGSVLVRFYWYEDAGV